MPNFTQIPKTAFDELQLDAGVLLKAFDLETGDFKNEDIICATTGGINITCTPTYSDFAEDVDNAPNNLKEFKHLDSWECKMSTTSLGTSAESIRMALGAADVDETTGAVTPRRTVKQTDFADLWWGGNKADGGFVAVQMLNALSTGGFSLQTTKNGKGQISLEFTGHVSLENQDVMPMKFYSKAPAAPSEPGGTETEPQRLEDEA